LLKLMAHKATVDQGHNTNDQANRESLPSIIYSDRRAATCIFIKRAVSSHGRKMK